ncbi:hypothetical protein 162319431 [Organic Lake phycodnavirus 2]|nr:hypothetical protein 162319431 [Organic Lake phycodnavirus 2]
MGLLDISGFFTGLIINLLLITLVCYYFKRKYENIESAQMEQAKVLYELLQQSSETKIEKSVVKQNYCETLDVEVESEHDIDDDDDDDDVSSSDEEEEKPQDELIESNVTEELMDETDYNKMSVKSLRDLLTNKGIKTNPKMKKNDLIRLANSKKSLVIDLAFEENSIEVTKLPEEEKTEEEESTEEPQPNEEK